MFCFKSVVWHFASILCRSCRKMQICTNKILKELYSNINYSKQFKNPQEQLKIVKKIMNKQSLLPLFCNAVVIQKNEKKTIVPFQYKIIIKSEEEQQK